jgi:hypothetical protein
MVTDSGPRGRARNQLAMALRFVPPALLALCLLANSGCGKDASSLGARYNKLFQSADEQTRTGWNTGVAALKTNGYAVTIVALDRLIQQPNLSAEQTAAIRETATAVNNRMYAAANKGDPAGTNAIAELRRIRSR